MERTEKQNLGWTELSLCGIPCWNSDIGRTDWIDFWTGEKYGGRRALSKETPIDILPLSVKAGSILPIGLKVEFAAEKKWDNPEIRIYPGADGKFKLCEDENDNYDYEKGLHSTITFTLDDAKKVLVIGERKGSFPGMFTRNAGSTSFGLPRTRVLE